MGTAGIQMEIGSILYFNVKFDVSPKCLFKAGILQERVIYTVFTLFKSFFLRSRINRNVTVPRSEKC